MQAFHQIFKYDRLPVSIRMDSYINFLAHWHTDVELIYVIKGGLKMGINDSFHTVMPGEIAICGSDDIHYYNGSLPDTQYFIVIFHPGFIDFSGGWPINEKFENSFLKNDWLINQDKDTLKRIDELFKSLYKEFDEQKYPYELLLKSKLLELCAIFLRLFPTCVIDGLEKRKRYNRLSLLKQTLDYIDNNYTEDISLETAASHLHISPGHFTKLFKEITGLSFKAFLTDYRLDKADNLLFNSDKTVTEISLHCGFGSVRSFNRCYKLHRGRAPSVQRNKS